ncbi:MAG: hypothetical protein KDD25_00685 [Bdellovibrionales bacterium]|nr:hypothetical protein [Bdellovibrionales bacterium]
MAKKRKTKVKRKPIPKKKFGFEWIFDDWEDDETFLKRRMFGGLAGYLNGKMMFVIVEGKGERTWKKKKYNFDLWYGVLVCTSREYHESLLELAPNLVSHPVLGKWLFLKGEDKAFESTISTLSELGSHNDERIGIWPKARSR